MKHDPDLVGFIQADLDEVVTPTQGAHLVHPLGKLAEGFQQLRMFIGHFVQARLEGHCRMQQDILVFVLSAPDRHVTTDLIENLLQ